METSFKIIVKDELYKLLRYFINQTDDENHWPVSKYDEENSTFVFRTLYDVNEKDVADFGVILTDGMNQICSAEGIEQRTHYVLIGETKYSSSRGCKIRVESKNGFIVERKLDYYGGNPDRAIIFT